MNSLALMMMLSPELALMVKVDGEGFLRFARGNTPLYARQAKLVVSNGVLGSVDGAILYPKIVVPVGTESLSVSVDGTVTGKTGNLKRNLGSIVLALFDSTPSFKPDGVLALTSAKAKAAAPGEGMAGVIRPIIKAGVQAQTAAQPFVAIKTEVKVNPTTEVDSDFFSLGTIAKINGDKALVDKLQNLEIGRSPVVGTKKTLSQMLLKALIASSGVDTRNVTIVVPTGAVVERKSQKLSADEILSAAAEGIKRRLGIEMTLEPLNKVIDLSVAPGKMLVEVSKATVNASDLTAILDITVDGKPVNTLNLRFSIANLTKVKQGEMVRLRLNSNFARVEVNAKVKTGGYLGQSITVESENGTTHTGKLVAANLVEVTL